MYNNGQEEPHVPYEKGSLALYTLSDYLGEENFNAMVRNYLTGVRFKSAPYTTAVDMVNHLKSEVPDSLQYLITDLFETVTLYDNKINKVTISALPNGQYEVVIDLHVSKYRSLAQGKRGYDDQGSSAVNIASLPLKDYIEIGVFGDSTDGLIPYHLAKHLIREVDSQLVIVVDERPAQVSIDPYFKLIDANLEDNTHKTSSFE